MRPALRLLPILLVSACASATATARREIQSQYEALPRAFAARDAAAVIAMRDPAFEVSGPQGQHDDYARRGGYTPDESVVRVRQRASRYQEREGRLRRVEHEVRQRETWIRTPGMAPAESRRDRSGEQETVDRRPAHFFPEQMIDRYWPARAEPEAAPPVILRDCAEIVRLLAVGFPPPAHPLLQAPARGAAAGHATDGLKPFPRSHEHGKQRVRGRGKSDNQQPSNSL